MNESPFPNEILEKIFQYVPSKNLLQAKSVCRLWRAIIGPAPSFLFFPRPDVNVQFGWEKMERYITGKESPDFRKEEDFPQKTFNLLPPSNWKIQLIDDDKVRHYGILGRRENHSFYQIRHYGNHGRTTGAVYICQQLFRTTNNRIIAKKKNHIELIEFSEKKWRILNSWEAGNFKIHDVFHTENEDYAVGINTNLHPSIYILIAMSTCRITSYQHPSNLPLKASVAPFNHSYIVYFRSNNRACRYRMKDGELIPLSTSELINARFMEVVATKGKIVEIWQKGTDYLSVQIFPPPGTILKRLQTLLSHYSSYSTTLI